MLSFKRVLGFIWAAPVTVFGLIYVTVFTLLGWYKRLGVHGDVMVWQPNLAKSPAWLVKAWEKWGGHCIGNVVVLKYNIDTDRGRVTLRHEQEHAHQYMVMGIFFLILYGLNYVTIKLACRHSDPYYSNIFEIDARRAAGQLVDVEGAIKRADVSSKLKPPAQK